ncbi:MAG TPA: polyphosphate kinase 1 [Actinomycetota bacterium]|nr:polyphosphate kinase 1 [Actinomycetota bacterium]
MEGEVRPDEGPRYLNRELSWLDFNARVLALAEDSGRPLLERVKFLAIVSRNLDEFFQIRVAGLKEQVRDGLEIRSPDGMTAAEQLRTIRTRVDEDTDRAVRLFQDELSPALEKEGIRFVDWSLLDEDDQAWLIDVFHSRIFPVLTPLAVDPGHPFPYISNLSLNLAVVVRNPGTGVRRFARVKIPPLLPRFVELPDGERFLPMEQLIAARLEDLFPGMEILARNPFRVTRDADLGVSEDEASDLLSAIETQLRRRRRLTAHVVRVEIERGMSEEMAGLLTRELQVGAQDVYLIDGPLDLGGLWDLYRLDRPELKDEPWSPVTPVRLRPTNGRLPDIFAALREHDLLVHHPYDSFEASVAAFVDQAASDPQVLAIKQTLYRTADEESPIIRSLIKAAESGKQVVALVELRARFDEQTNIAWARVLEEAGVHVVYGVVGLKTHAKISLVVRQEDDGIRRYAHVGTGNYNPNTAHLYEDVGIFSADPKLGEDLSDLFNYLTGYSRKQAYGRILVAPLTLRPALLDLIRAEASQPDGRIVIKVNNLVDPQLIDALYEASAAGTDVDLIVRSICCLRPRVEDLSERIRVRSIVGRFLEHARIFRFGSDARGPRYYIGSADLMERNLDRRVEALVPVRDPALAERVEEILRANLEDDTLAWELGNDGAWTRARGESGVSVHERLLAFALERAAGRDA